MFQEVEDREETLLFKVFSVLLVSLQCSLGLAIIFSWMFLGVFPLSFCCSSLGLLQDGLEVIKL